MTIKYSDKGKEISINNVSSLSTIKNLNSLLVKVKGRMFCTIPFENILKVEDSKVKQFKITEDC